MQTQILRYPNMWQWFKGPWSASAPDIKVLKEGWKIKDQLIVADRAFTLYQGRTHTKRKTSGLPGYVPQIQGILGRSLGRSLGYKTSELIVRKRDTRKNRKAKEGGKKNEGSSSNEEQSGPSTPTDLAKPVVISPQESRVKWTLCSQLVDFSIYRNHVFSY